MIDVGRLGLDFEKGGGLVTAIIQDFESGVVLMCVFMNREALQKTLESGKVHVWSRSQQRLRMKGEVSGHVQLVKEVLVDCDNDALLFRVEQVKAACHLGYRSCFFRKLGNGSWRIIAKKEFEPEAVYGG